MLTSFTIDDQRYDRVGWYISTTKQGFRVRLAVWASICPDCGQPFTYSTKRTHNPAKHYFRRCLPCRDGSRKRVSCNAAQDQFLPLGLATPIPAGWTPGSTWRKQARQALILPGHAEPLRSPLAAESAPQETYTPAPEGVMTDR